MKITTTMKAIKDTGIYSKAESWRCGDGCCVEYDHFTFEIEAFVDVVVVEEYGYSEYYIDGKQIEIEGEFDYYNSNDFIIIDVVEEKSEI